MKNVSITLRPHADIAMTKEDWHLYDVKDADIAAISLNAGAEEAINTSVDRMQAYHRLSRLIWNFREYGAADSEGYAIVDALLNKAFPDTDD